MKNKNEETEYYYICHKCFTIQYPNEMRQYYDQILKFTEIKQCKNCKCTTFYQGKSNETLSKLNRPNQE